MTTVRRAQAVDREGVLETVVAAFRDDPAWGFILSDDFERLAPHFVGALFDLRLATDTVWVTDDLAAAALWAAPGGSSSPPEFVERVWADYRTVAGESAWQRLHAYDRAVDACRPTTPYWYLGVLATRPDRQGEGLASAVMRPVLDRADKDELVCCLETSTTGNRAFYQGRGFTRAVEVDVDGGPPTWWLTRDPGTS